jgi:hypothetical protein
VSTFVLEDPQTLATVLPPEPRADLLVEYAGIAAVAHGVEDGGELADDGCEGAEVGGDAAAGRGVVGEDLVERLLHEREGGDAGELDVRRGEEEVLLVGGARAEGHAADVAVDLAPVVEDGVGIGEDGRQDKLARDCEKGSG